MFVFTNMLYMPNRIVGNKIENYNKFRDRQSKEHEWRNSHLRYHYNTTFLCYDNNLFHFHP